MAKKRPIPRAADAERWAPHPTPHTPVAEGALEDAWPGPLPLTERRRPRASQPGSNGRSGRLWLSRAYSRRSCSTGSARKIPPRCDGRRPPRARMRHQSADQGPQERLRVRGPTRPGTPVRTARSGSSSAPVRPRHAAVRSAREPSTTEGLGQKRTIGLSRRPVHCITARDKSRCRPLRPLSQRST